MLQDRKVSKIENKKKNLIESQRLNIEDVSDEEALDNKDVMAHALKKAVAHIDGHDIESSGDSSASDLSDSEGDNKFVNPLLVASQKQNQQAKESEEEWSDNSDEDFDRKGKKKDKKSILGKRQRKGKDVDNV